jgi:hypothetical protein
MNNEPKFVRGDKVLLDPDSALAGVWGGVMLVLRDTKGSLTTVHSETMGTGCMNTEDLMRLAEDPVEQVSGEFRFRNENNEYSFDSYESFVDCLNGFKDHSLKDNEAEIVQIVPHGRYAAKIRVEAV